jgi:hypothetical protein
MGSRGRGLLYGCQRRWLPIPASRRRGGSRSGARAARRHGELNSGATGRSGSPRRLLYGGGWSAGGDQRGGVAGGRWRLGVRAGRRPVPGQCSGWRRQGRRRTNAGWHRGGPWQRRRSSGSTLRRLCFDDNGASLGLEGGGGACGAAAQALKAQRHSPVNDNCPHARGVQRNEAGMKRGEREGEAFGVELAAVIGEREGGARGQRKAVGSGSLWAPAEKQRRRR